MWKARYLRVDFLKKFCNIIYSLDHKRTVCIFEAHIPLTCFNAFWDGERQDGVLKSVMTSVLVHRVICEVRIGYAFIEI